MAKHYNAFCHKSVKYHKIKPMKSEPINIALVNVIAVAIVFAVAVVVLTFLPRPTVSEIEKRELTKFPTFSSEDFFAGKYTATISKFYNDTVPNRDFFKKVSSNITTHLGFSFGSGKTFGNLQVVTEAPTVTEDLPPITTKVEEITTNDAVSPEITSEKVETTAPETTVPAVTTEKPKNEIADGVYTNGQIVVYQNGHWQGISMFGGGSGDNYAKAVNNFKQDLPKNVNVYSMVIPTASAYYTPSNFEKYNASHKDSIDNISSKLVNVTNIDAYSVLEAHTSEPIYTRTDHHWQPLGAYYAAELFAKTAGVPFTTIDKMEKVLIPKYVGSLYSFTDSADLLNDPEDFIYYKPKNDYTAYYYTHDYTYLYDAPFFLDMPVSGSYSTFMGGDDKIVRIETDCKNGKKLAILKDSYGNAEVPFYFGSYEEIFVIDIRYFTPNAIEFITENGIDDVLFSMCTFSAVGVNSKDIDKIRTQ